MPAFPSGTNTFIPDHETTGRMVVEFSRNPNDFAINQYCQIAPVKKSTGLYLEMTVEEAGRIRGDNAEEALWPDGADAPRSFDGVESFQWKSYLTERRTYDVAIGDKTSDQASWDIIQQHSRIKMQQAMTARTLIALNKLTNASNYDATHTADVDAIPGNAGRWDASTTARQDIKRSLNYAANRILLDTLGGVNLDQLMLVISPGLAAALSQTQEIVDHIKGSPQALAQVKGELEGRNAFFGLPDKLYGFPVVVEKTVRVSSRKGAASAVKNYVLPDTTAIMCARPGGLEGVAGAPSFSTCTLFMYEEMTVERKYDSDNRRTNLRVVDDFAAELTAPVSGYLFTNTLTA